MLAVAGRHGYVHIVDWRSGAAQVVGSVKMNKSVRSLWWSRTPGTESELMSLSEDAEVYMWDVGSRKCTRKWKEDGGYGATVIAGDGSGKYLSIGYNASMWMLHSRVQILVYLDQRQALLTSTGTMHLYPILHLLPSL